MNKCLYCDKLSLEEFSSIIKACKFVDCNTCAFNIEFRFSTKTNIFLLNEDEYICHTHFHNEKYELYYNYNESGAARNVRYYSSIDELIIFLYKFLNNIIFI